VIVVMMESVAMSEHRADTPEQVLKFVPKEWPNSYGAQVEEIGQAIVTNIQRAADLSNENCDRALALAHKLSMQLRTAEDRIWPVPGSEDTELGVLMELEVGHGETEVYPRVQA
jgi:hypothetical protein